MALWAPRTRGCHRGHADGAVIGSIRQLRRRVARSKASSVFGGITAAVGWSRSQALLADARRCRALDAGRRSHAGRSKVSSIGSIDFHSMCAIAPSSGDRPP
jgi:hypothetical protein